MAQRTYQAIDKTIDGLRISEFDAVSNLLAQPFNENNEYGVGRYVSYEGIIYQKIFETELINKIKQPYETQLESNPCTINGITWTVNSTGGIIADGTATEDSYYILNSSNRVSMGTFSLSGCPLNGSSSSYHLIAHFIIPPTAEIDEGGFSDWEEGEAVEGGDISPWTFFSEAVDGGQLGAWENYFDIVDTGDGITFELKESMNISSYELYCVIKEGASVDSIIFYPQLEEGSSISHYQTPNRLVEPWIREHWQYVEPDELGITERPPQVII